MWSLVCFCWLLFVLLVLWFFVFLAVRLSGLFVCLVGCCWLLVVAGCCWLVFGVCGCLLLVIWCLVLFFYCFYFCCCCCVFECFFSRLANDLLVAGRRPAKFGDGMHGGWWALWSSTWEKSLLREGWGILLNGTSCIEDTILDSSLQCRVRLKALKLQGLSN